jgi:copper chaperone CopZ
MKNNKKLIKVGLLTAIGSSLCCIVPILALISGTTGLAATFSWLEPFRPYLIGFTIVVLGFAWYRTLKPKKKIDCDCEISEKSSFIQSKYFLSIVTIFAIIMTTFPYYSSIFYPKTNQTKNIENSSNIKSAKIKIKGMTCRSCEQHINYSVNQVNGILSITSSYKKGIAEIKYDASKTTIDSIEKAINSTGYLALKN